MYNYTLVTFTDWTRTSIFRLDVCCSNLLSYIAKNGCYNLKLLLVTMAEGVGFEPTEL